MAVDEHLRPLTEAERAVLYRVLSVSAPGARELRDQLGAARVVRRWGERSLSVDLTVSEDCPSAPVPDGLAPMNGEVQDDSGGYLGEILLWVTAGRLSAMEFAWIGDAPEALPDPRLITPGRA